MKSTFIRIRLNLKQVDSTYLAIIYLLQQLKQKLSIIKLSSASSFIRILSPCLHFARVADDSLDR